MLKSLVGKKIKQTQAFTEDGKRIPVTDIQIGPCSVIQVKNEGTDGYTALQIGFDHETRKRIPSSLRGHLKKTGQGNYLPRFLREVRFLEDRDKESAFLKPGDTIKAEQVFAIGDTVKVTGVTKGKGFQGGVKRHGFKGGPRTHGQSDRERAPGAIGQTTTPGRVYKGKRMAGRMGGTRVTVRSLTVLSLDTEKQMLRIKGLVPGAVGSPVLIQKQE